MVSKPCTLEEMIRQIAFRLQAYYGLEPRVYGIHDERGRRLANFRSAGFVGYLPGSLIRRKCCYPAGDVSGSIRGQLATNKLGIVRAILEAKVACFWIQRILWVTEWVRCTGNLAFDKEVHFREIGLRISLRLIINGIDTDIRRKFVAPGIWIGVFIDELQFGGEWCQCNDLEALEASVRHSIQRHT